MDRCTSISTNSLELLTNAPNVPTALPKVPTYASIFILFKFRSFIELGNFLSLPLITPKPCASSTNNKDDID